MDRPKYPFYIPLMFGLMSGTALIGRQSLAGVRAVDIVTLIATGMCFGAAIPLFDVPAQQTRRISLSPCPALVPETRFLIPAR